MEFFFNELSIDEQFSNYHELETATNVFIDLILAISEVKIESKNTFWSSIFFSFKPISESRLDSYLKGNKDLNNRFLSSLQRLNPKPWERTRFHLSSISYTYNEIYCTDTSVAEIAERSISIENYSGLLLNYINSSFGTEKEVSVIKDKNNDQPILVMCVSNRNILFECLSELGIIIPGERKFEHHKKKHDRISPTSGNSILLCSEEEAQALLNEAVSLANRLYNYDDNNKKYIVFNMHRPNLYHGYHLEMKEVPQVVKNHFGFE